MAETPASSFRMNLRLKNRLEKIAKVEKRSLTYIVDKACSDFADEWDRRHGSRAKD
jgi:predicted transcriptional regulator